MQARDLLFAWGGITTIYQVNTRESTGIVSGLLTLEWQSESCVQLFEDRLGEIECPFGKKDGTSRAAA